jgi:GNAT superfamily N-acetyltransferase
VLDSEMMTKDSFHFRTSTAADIPAIRALIEASVRGLAGADYSSATIEGSLGHALDLDAQLIEDGTYFVAQLADAPTVARGEIVGSGGWSYRRILCGGDTLPGRDMSLLDPSTERARIRAIYVHPAWARRGLGTLILKHCEEAAAAAGFHSFEMGSTLTGVHLYERRGYQGRERVDIQLPNGEMLGVLRMTKTL